MLVWGGMDLKQWVQNWVQLGPKLEKIKREELKKMKPLSKKQIEDWKKSWEIFHEARRVEEQSASFELRFTQMAALFRSSQLFENKTEVPISNWQKLKSKHV